MTVIPYFIKEYKGFDREKFINGCWRKFVDIRKEYDLNEENKKGNLGLWSQRTGWADIGRIYKKRDSGHIQAGRMEACRF